MINKFIKGFKKSSNSQAKLEEFVLAEKTINKAAQGSMKKRNDLLKRVELSQSR